jgi:hypothetical protein
MGRQGRAKIPDGMDTAKSFHEPSFQGTAKAGKRERVFELSLPALVKGQEAAGRRFEERTAVCGISAQEVSFRLKSRLMIGAKVVLALDIPRTLILENPLRMVVSGSVSYVRYEPLNGKSQFVTVRLERGFRLQPNPYPASS